MTARSFGISKWSFSPELVAMPDVAIAAMPFSVWYAQSTKRALLTGEPESSERTALGTPFQAHRAGNAEPLERTVLANIGHFGRVRVPGRYPPRPRTEILWLQKQKSNS